MHSSLVIGNLDHADSTRLGLMGDSVRGYDPHARFVSLSNSAPLPHNEFVINCLGAQFVDLAARPVNDN